MQRQARRTARITFFCGAFLAVSISAGAAEERLRGVGLDGSLLVTAIVLCAAILTMALTGFPLNLTLTAVAPGSSSLRLRPVLVLVPQLFGIAFGLGLVHLILAEPSTVLAEESWRWVDDGVTSLGALMSIWACSAKLRLSVLALMLAGLLGYGLMTQPRPGCILSAQEMVVARVVAVATGLLAFRRLGAK